MSTIESEIGCREFYKVIKEKELYTNGSIYHLRGNVFPILLTTVNVNSTTSKEGEPLGRR